MPEFYDVTTPLGQNRCDTDQEVPDSQNNCAAATVKIVGIR